MRKFSVLAVTALFAALEAIFKNIVAIKGSITALGLSRKVLWVFAGIALLTALAFGSWALWERSSAQVAAPSAVLADVPKVTVPVTAVKAYAAPAKAKLRLPEAVQKHSGSVVLASTTLPASKHEREVSAVLNTDTAEATQYILEKPLPWFAKSNSGSVAIYAGLKNLEPAVRAEVIQDFYSVKGARLSGIASVDRTQTGATDTFIGVGARYEW